MNEHVALLLLRYLFSEWAVTRDPDGMWSATCRTTVSSGDLDGLLERLTVADPDAARRAVHLLRERSSAAS